MTFVGFKQPREKDNKRLNYIRSLPCCICGGINVDAAHIRIGSIGHGKRNTGMQEKPSDKWTVPLCREHHEEQHKAGNELKWWASKGIDPFMLAIMLGSKR